MPRDALKPSPKKPELNEPPRRSICSTCGASIGRTSDLQRHMLTHAKNKEELMFQCPYPDCKHRTLQRSNLETHIRTHTNMRPLQCTYIYTDGLKCEFATADPSSLHRHKKRKHENHGVALMAHDDPDD
ncbi:unnamed protein product [Mycena citricolor]|uniref:C2H2-type domain-containing protein n=1 Tax=Mycena citricolor TaxID=2018698 RepID=A0AAD2HJF6_9AGAR|nr:unnamed protein product [Mycena citricolor]